MENNSGKKVLKVVARLVAMLMLLVGVGMIVSSCEQNDNGKDMGVDTEVRTESDYLPGDPEVGDIEDDITNPITGARAYEEFQVAKDFRGDILSRVVVEYKGKKTEMQPSSAILEFSPDGKYLLYISNSSYAMQDGVYLYNIETGNTQELAPSVREDDPNYKPFPDSRYMRWEDGKITYDRFGKSWALTFDKEM